MVKKKGTSILKKFLVFNFLVFSILGVFTILYLKAIQPNLISKRSLNHQVIINNTNDHLERLNVKFEKENIKDFLLSTRFLFQSLDRVEFFDRTGTKMADTNILDLDQKVFTKMDAVIEQEIDSDKFEKDNKFISGSDQPVVLGKEIIDNYKNEPIVIGKKIKNNFFVSTIEKITINENFVGYIMVTEQSNDILVAVSERKNFVLRTILAVVILILIFSIFLNKYILNPIKFLVMFTEAIKNKSEKKINIDNFYLRKDELGTLTQSIDEMTKELQKRTVRAENFSTDLAHEIRNPLASLKGASEILDKTENKIERDKLLKIIEHDIERIERLITDYSQMLKDEASLSKEKMSKIDLLEVIQNVVEDFKQDLFNQGKKINIILNTNENNKKNFFILGIENRLEQVIANLLDNAVSFSNNNQSIEIEISETTKNFVVLVKDQGPGFAEASPQKIFSRFYSNRPKSFGEHSGLGLNIVKSIVELHRGKVSASNRVGVSGAQIEVLLPKLV